MSNVSKIACKWFKCEKNVPKFDTYFIKNYDKDSDKGFILEVDVEYPKNVLNLYGERPFLANRKKN